MRKVSTPRAYVPRAFEPIDTTWRDGLQSPLWNDHNRFYPTTEEMVELVEAQIRYGVRFFELFSPSVSERASQDMKAIIQTRDALKTSLKHPVYILAHARVDENDVEAALHAGVDGLNLYFGTSPVSLKTKHKKILSLELIAKKTRRLIEDVRKSHPHVRIRFSGEDAFRTKTEDLFKVYDELADIVEVFGTPDTVGGATPAHVTQRITELRQRYPTIDLEGHFQNDRGLSLINALVAVKAGMKYIDTSILGIAERSGLTSLTGLIFNLYKEDSNTVKDFDLISSYALNVFVADIMQMLVPSTEPVSATNRTHSAGVHTSAVLRNPETYEAHGLEQFGVDRSRLLLSPLSGRHIVNYFLTQFLNYTNIDTETLTVITSQFKTAASNIKKGSGITPELILQSIAKKNRLVRQTEPQTHLENL